MPTSELISVSRLIVGAYSGSVILGSGLNTCRAGGNKDSCGAQTEILIYYKNASSKPGLVCKNH